jgi:molybdenum cofactor cytidylyltransferase
LQLVDALRLSPKPAAPEVISFVGGGGKSSALFLLAQEFVERGVRVVMTTTTHIGAEQDKEAPVLVEMTGGRLPLDALARALDIHGQCLLVGPVEGEQRTGIAEAQVGELAASAARLGLGAVLVEADGSRGLPIKAPAAHEPAIPAATTVLIPVAGLTAIGRRIMAGQVHRPQRVRSLLELAAEDEQTRLTPRMAADLLIHPEGGVKRLPPAARWVALLNQAERPERLALGRLAAQRLAAQGRIALIGAIGASTDPEPIRERWAPLAAIVLAAGESRRMGRPKQLAVVDGEPMATRAVRVALESDAESIIVVTGAYAAEVETALEPLGKEAGARLRFVHNPQWQSGQSSSMQAGLAALPGSVEAALILPVDQPYLSPVVLRRMFALWRTGASLVAPLVDGGMRGAPALFDRSLWPELFTVEGDTGGRAVLQRHREQVTPIAVPGEQLRDIDTPADLVIP